MATLETSQKEAEQGSTLVSNLVNQYGSEKKVQITNSLSSLDNLDIY